jgi:hypothetical protein
VVHPRFPPLLANVLGAIHRPDNHLALQLIMPVSVNLQARLEAFCKQPFTVTVQVSAVNLPDSRDQQ